MLTKRLCLKRKKKLIKTKKDRRYCQLVKMIWPYHARTVGPDHERSKNNKTTNGDTNKLKFEEPDT